MRSLLVLPLLLAITAADRFNVSEDVLSREEREWRMKAIHNLWNERKAMDHTPLLKIEKINGIPDLEIYIKNETASASGTLKHRFAWALVLWAVVERKIRPHMTVYDSTSGNTGASEAYMCRLIGINFVAVVAKDIEQDKIDHIIHCGGNITKVDVDKRNSEAERLANETGGFFINQFGNAHRAEEFHESGKFMFESSNVFHEIREQLLERKIPLPNYFIHSAGTGGTISSVGKYINRYSIPTKVVMADSEYSLFYDYVLHNMYTNTSKGQGGRPDWVSPGIAGIGYGYETEAVIFEKTTSLLPTVVDEVARMPDVASIAAMRYLQSMGIGCGPSTALNFLVSLYKGLMHKEGTEKTSSGSRVSVVMIMGDPGKYYASTYLNDTWIDKGPLAKRGGIKSLMCWRTKIESTIRTGTNFMANATECAF